MPIEIKNENKPVSFFALILALIGRMIFAAKVASRSVGARLGEMAVMLTVGAPFDLCLERRCDARFAADLNFFRCFFTLECDLQRLDGLC